MPARRAASAFEPMTYVWRPKRVSAEHERADQRHDEGDPDDPIEGQEAAGAHVDQAQRDAAHVVAVRDQAGEAEGRAERAQRRDQRGHAQLGDAEPVEHAPGEARDARRDEADDDRQCVVGSQGLHRLHATDAGEDEHGADREVEPAGDHHERHADGHDHQHRRVHQDVAEVVDGREGLGLQDREDHDQDEQHAGHPDRRLAHRAAPCGETGGRAGVGGGRGAVR